MWARGHTAGRGSKPLACGKKGEDHERQKQKSTAQEVKWEPENGKQGQDRTGTAQELRVVVVVVVVVGVEVGR